MSLAPGTRLAHYEIVESIGKGGMGEVYRARDGKLGRDVAIKVLPEEFAENEERLARFKREAKVLASLNHPNIASIYGLEQSGNIHYLVLELVPGETLAERISRGPIPLEEALDIATQMAEALEEAHEQGIVHRDLKPANVKQTEDGKIKVLDYGLAKVFQEGTPDADSSMSPTLTRDATRVGVILGTAAYMSPEQAKGKKVDRRTDIWAFGVVLFEMLTDRRLFSGETVSDTLAAVLRQEIEWNHLPAATPPSVRWLLMRCLERDPKKRLRDIGEARIAVEAREQVVTASMATAPLWRRALPWVLCGTLALMMWAQRRPAAEPPTLVRLSVELGVDASLAASLGPAAILSPDGKLLVFAARTAAGESPQLYVRRLDQLTASPLPGTEDGANPFFSPDGEWIAFFADGKLKKVGVTGDRAVTLCDAPNSRGGTWSEDGTILFVPGTRVGLSRVSSAGGTAEVLTTPDPSAGENSHRWPQSLQGGRQCSSRPAAAPASRTRASCCSLCPTARGRCCGEAVTTAVTFRVATSSSCTRGRSLERASIWTGWS